MFVNFNDIYMGLFAISPDIGSDARQLAWHRLISSKVPVDERTVKEATRVLVRYSLMD